MIEAAWVFPGQGSQVIGMGGDLLDLSLAQERYQVAEKVLGWSVAEVCQRVDDTVSQTLYTQPCLYVVEAILADLMMAQGLSPAMVAGHSLGEYVALYAAGVYDFATGLRLVQRRAELMDRASEGSMAALIGFDRQALEQVLAETPGVVLANDNSDAQVVISGQPQAVEAVMTSVKSKRAVKLNVSGAFHSPLMATAAQEFQAVLDGIPFQDARVPVLSNVQPAPATDGDTLKRRLAQQMTGSVRWREIMQYLSEEQVSSVIEVGPGKVLSGLIKRACRGMELDSVSTLEDLNGLTERLLAVSIRA